MRGMDCMSFMFLNVVGVGFGVSDESEFLWSSMIRHGHAFKILLAGRAKPHGLLFPAAGHYHERAFVKFFPRAKRFFFMLYRKPSGLHKNPVAGSHAQRKRGTRENAITPRPRKFASLLFSVSIRNWRRRWGIYCGSLDSAHEGRKKGANSGLSRIA